VAKSPTLEKRFIDLREGGLGLLERLLTPEDLAECMGVSVKTVLRYVREGKLGSIKLDAKNIRFTQDQVDEFVRSRTRSELKKFDKPKSRRIPLPRKGGKITGDTVRARLKEEMAPW
jgi:excisionase family DNA binding protein